MTVVILSRLPLRDVAQCSAVCHAWRELTIEPSIRRTSVSRETAWLLLHKCGHERPSGGKEQLVAYSAACRQCHASVKSTLIKKALSLKQRSYIYVHMHEGVNVRDTREWLMDGVTTFDDKSKALRSILGVAKYVADNRLASFVIMGSGGELVYISRISSALSRARMLQVESVSKKILVEYIMKKYKELESRESEVHELLRLTGSKILSINLWARMLLHKPIEQVKVAYMEEVVYHCFARAGLLDQENRPWVVKLLEALRGNGGRLHVRKLQKIVPLSKVLRINSSNLFSINEKRELCFESEVYMDYAEEILAEDYAVTTNMKKTE
ncbi:hypothetical protein SELMODRAFT_411189 [Selaginella moellendorffii]|uniref:F-box domain-containing protein n=1 Tax=Selaginella moellendorffii TaxID=88036 RepID=D8RGV0_SELML|nr:hypothetical protein SELMODRAFT_411189 [Selaginella moellendorffii]